MRLKEKYYSVSLVVGVIFAIGGGIVALMDVGLEELQLTLVVVGVACLNLVVSRIILNEALEDKRRTNPAKGGQ